MFTIVHHKSSYFLEVYMLDFTISLARNAGEFIFSHAKKDLIVEHKGRIDLVTQVDKETQRRIVNAIESRFPNHSILAEEGVKKSGSDGYEWIIDPIDGTTNFVHKLPVFCVSIALYKDNTPLVGVCLNPATNELFSAEAEKGAFLNGQKISVSSTERLVDSLVATGFPYKTDNMQRILSRFSRVVSEAQGIRRLGSAALDLCYVACGHFDAFWEEGLNPWDMAAGALIVKEAGGKISCIDGSDFDLSKGNIVASNAKLHDQILALM
jgi:myo-inositol-1(or 4)-monophosphatase